MNAGLDRVGAGIVVVLLIGVALSYSWVLVFSHEAGRRQLRSGAWPS
jgi:hypothetical protein